MKISRLLRLAGASGSLATGLVCALTVGGCSDDKVASSPDAAPQPTPDAPPAAAGTIKVRVAHLSPDAPAVDFCLAAHGTTAFTGPVLKGAGATAGLAYAHVTRYLDLAAGQYDVRLVAPGAADCATSLGGLPDVTDLPALPDQTYATLAAEGLLAGSGATAFAIRPYVDDASVASGKAKLRFVHASPGTPAVDVGVGGGVLFAPLFADVAFGATATAGNGYVEAAPFSGVEVSARAHGGASDVLAIKGAALPAGAIATAFAIGQIGNAAAPLRVLLCVDNAPSTGALGTCLVAGDAPERAHVRIAHLSPDAPAVDACIAPTGSGAFVGPLLRSLGASGGLAYPQVTTYVDLPVASYDLRVVAAGATSCATGLVPDTTGVAVAKDLTATIAALGVVDKSGAAAGDPGFALAVFADDTTVAAGKTKVRFVHASPGTPAVDVGLGKGTSFTKVFANVAFGKIATGGGLDGNGYVETSPVTTAVSARLAGQNADALTVPSVTLAADGIATAFAIGGKTGAATNPLKVLLCADRAATTGLLSTCTTAP